MLLNFYYNFFYIYFFSYVYNIQNMYTSNNTKIIDLKKNINLKKKKKNFFFFTKNII